MRQISEYSITDHGVDNCQYFQGHGISFTEYEDTVTGCGNTYNEAFEDALESLAQNDWDTSTVINDMANDPQAEKTVMEWLEIDTEEGEDCEGCDCYYYVSIDVK